MATKFKSKLFYGKTGFFDSVGIGVSEPENGLHISGADFKLESGQAYFQYRPVVSGFPVMLSGDTISIDVSDLYPADNPSGFITGVDTSNFYTNDNPSGFITGVNLSSYVTNTQTGAFYPASNPSGFLTAVTVSGAYVANSITNISGATRINNMMQITQAGYNAITPAANTLYIIVG
jgi:hypothetical protein